MAYGIVTLLGCSVIFVTSVLHLLHFHKHGVCPPRTCIIRWGLDHDGSSRADEAQHSIP